MQKTPVKEAGTFGKHSPFPLMVDVSSFRIGLILGKVGKELWHDSYGPLLPPSPGLCSV
jgi:hypothetical protein